MYTHWRIHTHTRVHTHKRTHVFTHATLLPCISMPSSPEVSGVSDGVAAHSLHIPLLLLIGFLKSLVHFLQLCTAFASGFDPILQPYTMTLSSTWYACSRHKVYEGRKCETMSWQQALNACVCVCVRARECVLVCARVCMYACVCTCMSCVSVRCAAFTHIPCSTLQLLDSFRLDSGHHPVQKSRHGGDSFHAEYPTGLYNYPGKS